MKKYILLVTISCFSIVFVSSCSFFDHSSNIEISALKNNTQESESNDAKSDNQNSKDAGSADLQNAESNEADIEINNDQVSGTDNTTQPSTPPSSDSASSPSTDEIMTIPEIQTSVGYILSCDENTIYVDLKNTGSRLYPGEGEDRKVAFDISKAEQVQTNISEFNPVKNNLITPGIQVTIEYYVENGMNIATKLTSDGDEKEPYSPVAIGKVISVSDTELIVSVTEGDDIGETVIFDLSTCDPILDEICVDSQVAVAYYTKQDINYAVYISCMS